MITIILFVIFVLFEIYSLCSEEAFDDMATNDCFCLAVSVGYFVAKYGDVNVYISAGVGLVTFILAMLLSKISIGKFLVLFLTIVCVGLFVGDFIGQLGLYYGISAGIIIAGFSTFMHIKSANNTI